MMLHTTKHLIAYIDILGYTNMLETFQTEDMFLEYIDHSLHTAFEICNNDKQYKMKVQIFSDNIIFALEFE